MPKNLEQKIRFILEDVEKFDRTHAVKELTALLEKELGFTEETVNLNDYDLHWIGSAAVDQFNKKDMSMRSKFVNNASRLRAWAYTMAVLSWMKKEGLIKFTLNYEDLE